MDSVGGDLLKTLIGLGPGGILAAFLFYLWKDERAERRALQEKLMQQALDGIEAEKDMTKALETLAGKIK